MGHFDHKFRVGQFYLPKSESESGERSTRIGRQYIYWTRTSEGPNCRKGSREKVFIVFCKWSSQEGIWALTPNSTRIWVEMGRICGSPKAYLGLTMTGNFGTKVSASANFRVKKVSLSDTCRYQFSHPFHGEKKFAVSPHACDLSIGKFRFASVSGSQKYVTARNRTLLDSKARRQ